MGRKRRGRRIRRRSQRVIRRAARTGRDDDVLHGSAARPQRVQHAEAPDWNDATGQNDCSGTTIGGICNNAKTAFYAGAAVSPTRDDPEPGTLSIRRCGPVRHATDRQDFPAEADTAPPCPSNRRTIPAERADRTRCRKGRLRARIASGRWTSTPSDPAVAPEAPRVRRQVAAAQRARDRRLPAGFRAGWLRPATPPDPDAQPALSAIAQRARSAFGAAFRPWRRRARGQRMAERPLHSMARRP